MRVGGGERPMLSYLRIAASVLCVIACVLFGALWVRSYCVYDLRLTLLRACDFTWLNHLKDKSEWRFLICKLRLGSGEASPSPIGSLSA